MDNALALVFFLSFCFLIWASFGAYVGMTAFLAMLPEQPRLFVFIFTSATIVFPMIFLLCGQDVAVEWLYGFNINNFATDRTFYTGAFVLNACFYSGMGLSLLSGRYLPPQLRRLMRITCLAALTSSLIGLVALAGEGLGSGIVIPILFLDHGFWCVISFSIFLIAIMATVWRFSTVYERDGTDPSTSSE